MVTKSKRESIETSGFNIGSVCLNIWIRCATGKITSFQPFRDYLVATIFILSPVPRPTGIQAAFIQKQCFCFIYLHVALRPLENISLIWRRRKTMSLAVLSERSLKTDESSLLMYYIV